ncbi:hypothetical protein [Candidatus Rhabdochlamydia sp. T3358]|uniref:hypothetical protein n=1 Tax=Candidatus Rhabdochlamydia sp. T3358 TaxID=2099795 RepID=UPI0010BB4D85|nr:hypothetical protein [Candidatus Rhabdochlamydia sp. T3358]VHO00965.1 Chromosome partition protein Smc [Candidatus Rhabdochlamydia sp. T3358]
MINKLNISNLQMFNQEGSPLSCPNDLQEAIQTGIAKKVGKLLNAEGFLALIPDFDPSKDTKLRIHLTKDEITIQLLERDLENLKIDTSYTKKDPELSEEIKTRKEKIIKKVDSLFKEPFSLDPSARLESEKIRPLFIPSPLSQDEQVPFKIGFDATLSSPQIQQLHAKIEELKNQLNKKTPHSEELQVIKEQLASLSQAIHNLSKNQENITYPHTEEYALINKLVDNQRDVYRALLDLLSRNLNQTPTPLPSVFQDAEIKEMPKENAALEELIDLKEGLKELSKEKTDLESEHEKLTEQLTQAREAQTELSARYTNNIEELKRLNTVLQTQLSAKNEQINELDKQIKSSANTYQELEEKLSQSQKEKLEELSQLPLQLSLLQQEKDGLEIDLGKVKGQLDQARKTQSDLFTDYNNKIEELNNSNVLLQTQLSTKNKKIAELEQQIKNSGNTHQELEEQLSLLQQELGVLKQSSSLINENHEKTSQLLRNKEEEIAALQEKLNELPPLTLKLSNLQQEKNGLDLEYRNFTKQLELTNQNQIKSSTNFENEIKKLDKLTKDLQMQLSAKDEEIFELNEQFQRLSETHQALQSQLENEKEISRILETAAIPEVSKEIASIDTIIKEAEKTTEEDLSSLESSTIAEVPLTPTSDYYTLTTPSLEESLETSSEITLLQAEINDLQEELKDIRPIAYNTTSIIQKMEKSSKDLTLELSEKTKTIENLEEEKKFLEFQLDRSELQVKELKTAQYQLKEQQKEISISSEENNDLLEALEKIHEQLSLEKKERAQLEQIHEDQLEKLKTLYDKNALEKMEHINAKIINLQQEQKTICFTLAQALAEHVNSGSITESIGKNIFDLIEKAFSTSGYKTLLDLVSSEEEDLGSSSEESVSSDEYDEDSYIGL